MGPTAVWRRETAAFKWWIPRLIVLQDPDEFTALELANIAGHDNIVALLEKANQAGTH